mmetsp:Transcript_80286/g.167163  ORF Transcript_80286/g.167163 Transcript_80286/m.167163 type:complete len:376 (+) Transcript_80286:1-1128(+)
MVSLVGVAFASCMVLRKLGSSGLRRAWDPAHILKFSLCGFLMAVTQSLLSMAYALGTTPTMVAGLGKIYTPIVAILCRCCLGRVFAPMEWLAVGMLTVSALAFCLLEGGGHHHTSFGLQDGSLGVLLVAGSATTSAMMSVLTERFMKAENEPFIVHKVRLDAGGFLFSLLLLPLMGMVGMSPDNSREDLAFWAYRPGPDYWTCYNLAIDQPGASRGCDQATGTFHVNRTLVAHSPLLSLQAESCECSRGVFLGWGSNKVIYLFLAVAVFHSWITGRFIASPRFSSVDRAVADGIPLMTIYFVMDPLSSRMPFKAIRSAYSNRTLPFPPADFARNLSCLAIALSIWMFANASSQKAGEAQIVDVAEVAPEEDESIP